MPRLSLPFAVGSVLLLHSTLSLALGFGPTRLQNALGQRLDFAASLTLEADETVRRECVSAEVQAGDFALPPRNVRTVLQPTADPSRPMVRVTTDVAIDEPIVTVEVSVGCGSRMTRRFVVFVDPPGLRLAEVDDSETVPLPRQIDSQTASLSDIARQADASRRGRSLEPSASEPRSPRRTVRPSRALVAESAAVEPVAPRPRTAPRPPRTRTALGAAPAPGGARLQLDRPTLLATRPSPTASAPAKTPETVVAAAPAVLAVQPGAVAVQPAAAASAPAAEAVRPALPPRADVAAAEALDAAQRLSALEADAARARGEAQAAQKSIAALQARLREAETGRFSNALVYTLLATTLLALLAVAALWWLRPRQRRQARWFEAQANAQARAQRVKAEAPVLPVDSLSTPLSMSTATPAFWSHEPPADASSTRPAAIGGLEVTTVLGPEWRRPPDTEADLGPDDAGPAGMLSMEELIDLEQQAEFFVVLGQDEAAIALLDRHTRGSGGNSPLPYLQLLEIHQRRGDQAAYDRVRKSFDERFDASAPDWTADLHLGRGLDDYPQTVARLQSLWETPMSAMEALESLLFRRQGTEETFDFPAYRELLFLYSVARDISANVETDRGSIDLFLPLDDPQRDSVFTDLGGPTAPVDLDVTNWPEEASMSDLAGAAPQRGG